MTKLRLVFAGNLKIPYLPDNPGIDTLDSVDIQYIYMQIDQEKDLQLEVITTDSETLSRASPSVPRRRPDRSPQCKQNTRDKIETLHKGSGSLDYVNPK